MPIRDIGSIALAYAEHGAGDPVLLLHGQGGRGDAWALQVPALAATYRVLTPDLRGHGGSTVTPRPYTMPRLADDIAGLIRSLDLPPCHIVGHSLGGMVALQLALDAPGLVRSLAIVNSTAFGDGSKLRSLAVRTFIRLRGMPAFARANTRLHLPDPDQEPLRKRLVDLMGDTPAAGYIAAQDAVDAFDVRPRLAQIAAPTLVVHSDHDLIPLADKQLLANTIPRARLAIVEQSRHLVVWDQPERLTALLLAHLAAT